MSCSVRLAFRIGKWASKVTALFRQSGHIWPLARPLRAPPAQSRLRERRPDSTEMISLTSEERQSREKRSQAYCFRGYTEPEGFYWGRRKTGELCRQPGRSRLLKDVNFRLRGADNTELMRGKDAPMVKRPHRVALRARFPKLHRRALCQGKSPVKRNFPGPNNLECTTGGRRVCPVCGPFP